MSDEILYAQVTQAAADLIMKVLVDTAAEYHDSMVQLIKMLGSEGAAHYMTYGLKVHTAAIVIEAYQTGVELSADDLEAELIRHINVLITRKLAERN